MDEDLRFQTIELSVRLRGTVLESTVEIERKIDDYLSNYFCKDEVVSNELKEMLWATERVTLANKKDIFFMLLNRYKKELLKQHPQFIDCLDKIVPHRNIFAHLEIDLDYTDYEEGNFEIKFKKYNKGKLELKKYTKKDIEKMRDDFNYINAVLDLLLISKAPKS